MAPEDDRWMTVAEIAEEWPVQPATVRSWIRKGNLEAKRIGGPNGRKLVVRRSRVLAYMGDGERPSERVEQSLPSMATAANVRLPNG